MNLTTNLTPPFSAVFMERHAEHEASAPGDWASAVLDRLQSYDATRAYEAIARAEQRCIAEDFLTTRLSPFRRIAEQELPSLEALCVRVLLSTRAQYYRHLDWEEQGA